MSSDSQSTPTIEATPPSAQEPTNQEMPQDKMTRLTYQQLAHNNSDELVYVTWTGPYGAIHCIRPDFWARNWLLTTRGLPPQAITEFHYVQFRRFGSIQKIHSTLLREFDRFIDTSHGESHTNLDDTVWYDHESQQEIPCTPYGSQV